MMKHKQNNWLSLCIYLVFAIFYLWLASRVPYTHDDWDWGLDIGMQQLITANLNSRYAGNFLEVVMTRSKTLKTLIMGACFFLLPLAASSIVVSQSKETNKNRKLLYYLLSNILLLLMNRQVWQQTYGWVAGFANFVVSALFLLCIIKEGLSVFQHIDTKRNRYSLKCIFLLLLGIISQLFLENVAIFLFLYSLAISIIYYKRTHTLSKAYTFLAIGTLIGLVILFSSSIYQRLWQTGNAVGGYRNLYVNANASPWSFLAATVIQFGSLLGRMLGSNMLIYGCILLLLSATFLLQGKVRTKRTRTFLYMNLGIVGIFILLYIVPILSHIAVHIVLNVICIPVITMELIDLFKDTKLLFGKLMSLWLSTFAVLVPLIVTSQSGPRLYFTTHVLLILLALLLLTHIIDLIPQKAFRFGIICSIALVICAMAFYGKIYYDIGECMHRRNTIIAQAIESGANVVVLPKFPHTNYLWCPNPSSDTRMAFFKEFYGIPQEVTVIFEE